MKRGVCTTDKLEVARQILAYLMENPNSQDTQEGIADWWLLEQRIYRETAKVREALAELLAKGFILEREGMDSRIHYRINRHKLAEIRALLRQTPG